jgi:hypothetical protein
MASCVSDGCPDLQLLWVVLRQDTFVPSDGYQQVRLDTFTGKTLRSMDSLKVGSDGVHAGHGRLNACMLAGM